MWKAGETKNQIARKLCSLFRNFEQWKCWLSSSIHHFNWHKYLRYHYYVYVHSIQTYEHVNQFYTGTRQLNPTTNNHSTECKKNKWEKSIHTAMLTQLIMHFIFNYQRDYYCFSAFDSTTYSKEYCFVSHATWTLSIEHVSHLFGILSIWVQKRKKKNEKKK